MAYMSWSLSRNDSRRRREKNSRWQSHREDQIAILGTANLKSALVIGVESTLAVPDVAPELVVKPNNPVGRSQSSSDLTPAMQPPPM
jgi:hypothetical protein